MVRIYFIINSKGLLFLWAARLTGVLFGWKFCYGRFCNVGSAMIAMKIGTCFHGNVEKYVLLAWCISVWGLLGDFFSNTPLKSNMEPKNHPIEKENHLTKPPFFRFHVTFPRGYQGFFKSLTYFSNLSKSLTVTNSSEKKIYQHRPQIAENNFCVINVEKKCPQP